MFLAIILQLRYLILCGLILAFQLTFKLLFSIQLLLLQLLLVHLLILLTHFLSTHFILPIIAFFT